MSLKQSSTARILSAAIAACLLCAGVAHGQTATAVHGLYYTGMNTVGTGLQTQGTQESHWRVTYVAGTNLSAAANEGAAYVLTNAALSGSGYVANTATAQWITAPGAMTAQTGGTLNTGGDFLPGNGNSGANEGVFVYTLAFQITGSGAAGTLVTNAISIGLTAAADDQYSIYVNPGGYGGNGTALPTGTAAVTRTTAWTNTAVGTLQNGTNGTNGNSRFYIGTNYVTIVVDNTNSISGSSTATALNASGLMVYELSNAVTINGAPITGFVPEVGAWLPVAAALGLFGLCSWRRRTDAVSRRARS
jgi:hypothetical protein